MSVRKKFNSMQMKKVFLKRVSLLLAAVMLFEIVFPTCAWALGSGPSQPEVMSFEPVGTSDMVDPFSGDFHYNIPLLDVDGYPVNISYNSGITMDQEASWVGLGWNINPGVVNRGMRGLPDDFNGDEVIKKLNQKPNRTIGASAGFGLEIVGFPKTKEKPVFGLDFSIGPRYNNYSGFSVEKNINASITGKKGSDFPLTGSLGINSSKENGLTIQPSVSYSKRLSGTESQNTNLGIKVGSAFNTRAGLKSLTINSSLNRTFTNSGTTRRGGNAYSNTYKGLGLASAGASWDFGMQTYTPQVQLPMENFNITGSFKNGPEIKFAFPNFTASAYFSSQKLSTNEIKSPAYGYVYTNAGSQNDAAMLDFNREKDGSFTESTPSLPLTNFTYDVYSVTGQGMSGSFRPFRSDIGYVYDPEVKTVSRGGSIGAELGAGDIAHVGIDITVNASNSTSGRWTEDNEAASYLNYRSNSNGSLFEASYFKEANEKSVEADPDFFNHYGSFDAYRVNTNQPAKFKTKTASSIINNGGNNKSIALNNYRSTREHRNMVITTLTRSDLDSLGLEKDSRLYSAAKGHHIAEITSLGNDGMRYVYGIAAYNKTQEEITFATGANTDRGPGERGSNCNTGMVNYVSSGNTADNSLNNTRGLDNYYSNTIMPAYAHSYMLTAVLSSDYVDSDKQRGPSDGDIGTYTKFNYSKISNYKWRTPIQKDSASYSEGLRSIKADDKGNIIYGEKELWYLQSIVTKNYIAVFHTSAREDGYPVIDVNGGIDTLNAGMQKLDSISLYVKPEYLKNPTTAVPLKRVHFVYDYSLCKNIPNQKTAGQGKLTLKKIFFTYQKSNKGRFSPYEFEYNGLNPDYNIKGYDRWGCYKPQPASACGYLSPSISNSDYPYVEQNKTQADQYTSAWTLTDIILPSGGKIQVHYETDDYAYVQNKKAMQMFKIVNLNSASDTGVVAIGLVADANRGDKLFFKLPTEASDVDIQKYFSGIDNLYFRCLTQMDVSVSTTDTYEYISGYAQIDSIGKVTASGETFGFVRLKQVKLNDNGLSRYSPIEKAAIQFARTYMSKQITSQPPLTSESTFDLATIQALLSSQTAAQLIELVTGPNVAVHTKNYCQKIITNKSWIRLNNPIGKKLGGGCRVKKVEISDEWNTMTASAENKFSYGQEYKYDNEDGTSSGVASYEPQLGGDENPLRQPDFFSEEKLLAPDEDHYMEKPYGESFYPSPSVGYGRVTVSNLQYENVKRHATGYVVHEFYTAKEFPVITNKTDLNAVREKDAPYGVRALLNIDVRDYMTVTQGYVVELNDMHGKPKAQRVYQEDITTPISSVEYKYKSVPYLDNSKRLQNNCTVIYPNGTHGTAQAGVFFDGVFDTRQQQTSTYSPAISFNVETTSPFIVVPTIFPSFSSERTRFRSMVFTKVIQRFGLLDETIAYDLGSRVATSNLAYDAETGDVLLTKTTTDFNDSTYTFNFPAHWYYDGMGLAYKNIGFYKSKVNFGTDGVATVANAKNYFNEGDELALYKELPLGAIAPPTHAWVTAVGNGNIQALDKTGGVVYGTYRVKVIRSGRKNMASQPMASITSLSNPLTYISGNAYEKVLQASATEFTDEWKTNCDCFTANGNNTAFSNNPYVLGTKGNWKANKAYLHLTGRTQSNYNNNTNIRKDGIMSSFSPFYKLSGGDWNIDGNNWTFTSEVTEFNPYGKEIENKDALGRYSSALFSFNQTFYEATTANAKYKESGFDSFEDYDFSDCADNHFRFEKDSVTIDTVQSHTGRRSIKVASSAPAELTRSLALCDTSKCNLAFAFNGSQITVTGGTGPYAFSWDITKGGFALLLNSSGNGLLFSGMQTSTTTIEIYLDVTDGLGCKLRKRAELLRDVGTGNITLIGFF